MRFKPAYFLGIGVGLLLMALDFLYFFETRWFYALLVLSLSVSWIQFWIDFLNENKRQKEIETKFLEFVHALVGTVKSGIPIPQALVQASGEDYGALTPYTKKLARQIEWGIPSRQALLTFSRDTRNSVIKRSIAIVIEAEESGGDIESVLESVTESVYSVKKIKAERRSSVYGQIVQGYIVFYIFIGIMLVLQLQLFPLIKESTAGGVGGLGIGGGFIGQGEEADLDTVFLSLLLIQGFFTGILIGKFSEGTLKQGLIHSVILMTSAALLITTIKGGL